MKSFKFYCISLKRNILPIIFILFLFCLIVFSASNLSATKSGLSLWANSVVPSLFPFLVATELLSYTNVVNFVSSKLDKFMRPIFNMPGCSAYPLILGMLSGYPVGAKTVCQIYKEGLCTKREAELILAYTNNSGPLFIIGTVGISMFGSTTIGLILLSTHMLASLSVGIIFGKKIGSKYKSINKSYVKSSRQSVSFSNLGEVLSNSIISSIKTIMMIGGFVVIFSVIISILKNSGLLNMIAKFLSPLFGNSSFISGILSGIIELTNGLNAISSIHVKAISTNILLCSFLLGFGGFSVMLQILSVVSKEKLSIKPYIIGKILQAILATAYTFVILQIPMFNFNLWLKILNIYSWERIYIWIYLFINLYNLLSLFLSFHKEYLFF